VQQRAILEVIAVLKRDELGRYYPENVSNKMIAPGDRSAQASLSRAIIRLEGRGLIQRHHQHIGGRKHGFYCFTLTEAGLEIINDLRSRQGLDALEMITYTPAAGMTDEEFSARLSSIWARITDEEKLHQAKDAATRLNPRKLKELREWIDARLAEGKATDNG
jgi:DNA-binding MarR family transcriptional regulator